MTNEELLGCIKAADAIDEVLNSGPYEQFYNWFAEDVTFDAFRLELDGSIFRGTEVVALEAARDALHRWVGLNAHAYKKALKS